MVLLRINASIFDVHAQEMQRIFCVDEVDTCSKRMKVPAALPTDLLYDLSLKNKVSFFFFPAFRSYSSYLASRVTLLSVWTHFENII